MAQELEADSRMTDRVNELCPKLLPSPKLDIQNLTTRPQAFLNITSFSLLSCIFDKRVYNRCQPVANLVGITSLPEPRMSMKKKIAI